MTKQYYIKITEKLMASELNANEKILLAFLEVLTDKGVILTDKSNSFFSAKTGLSQAYISILINGLKSKNMIFVKKVYARRSIAINVPLLLEKGFISKKTIRGGKNAE